MNRYVLLAGVLVVVLLAAALPPRPADASDICFPDNPDVSLCIADTFSEYWQSNGGLPVFGYPITEASEEWSAELETSLLTQWTERNRLEYHPENDPPYHILLGRMGADRLAQLGRDPTTEGREEGPREGCLWFEQTGHNVCNQEGNLGFKTYWETHGLRDPLLDSYGQSLALFGYPLTEAKMETNPDDGKQYLTQWFERARFEWHPENPAEYRVLLGLLGTELHNGTQPSPSPSPTPAPSPPGSSSFAFGAEINQGHARATAAMAAEAGITWVRYNGIRWDKVEATQGTYDWSKLEQVEQELRALAEQDLTPMVIIRGTPAWAQSVAGSRCSAIKPEALDAFASFVGEVVQRYSKPPYNVRYWEMGNEPDVDPSLISDTMPFGCWGNKNDPYYGGGAYADMLKRVYPTIKQADPTAQVIIGGLLLDCDPTNPSAGKDCTPGTFFEGILRNDGERAFDLVAYHGYAFWAHEVADWDYAHSSWAHRGGAMLGRLDFLRSVMDRYEVEKPVIVNEIALLCYENNPYCAELGYEEDAANYAIRTYVRAWAEGLAGAVWYTFNHSGWHDAGLLSRDREPRPAYHAIKFLTGLLDGATYEGPPAETPGSGSATEGYGFRKGDTRYLFFWTNGEQEVPLTLPAGTQAVYDMLGNPVATSDGQATVQFEPVVLVVQE
jgi:hypothetical protein